MEYQASGKTHGGVLLQTAVNHRNNITFRRVKSFCKFEGISMTDNRFGFSVKILGSIKLACTPPSQTWTKRSRKAATNSPTQWLRKLAKADAESIVSVFYSGHSAAGHIIYRAVMRGGINDGFRLSVFVVFGRVQPIRPRIKRTVSTQRAIPAQ